MRAPAVPVVAAFAAGIVLGNYAGFFPAVWIALAVVFLLAALGALRRNFILSAGVFGLAAWIFLGALAASMERVDRPQDNAAAMIASGRLDASEALRWSGRLRADPVRVPGGLRYDVDLEQVQAAGKMIAVSGGLRASLFADSRHATSPVELRAGDRAEFLLRASVPRNYLDPGAFDSRAYFERQGIHLVGTLRDAALVAKLDGPAPTWHHLLARARGQLLGEVDSLFAQAPDEAAILRAMLLGDRGFLDQDIAVDFQKTAVYHVLVIAGLHVAALAWFVFWLARKLRLRMEWRVALTLLALAAFVAVVEDRTPIIRAALMATILLASQLMFRRIEALNTVAVAALAILAFHPAALLDPSFQLSFVAVGSIGVLAVPWVERTSEPYRRALAHLGDVTRDPGNSPATAQFRLDARAVARWLESRLPQRLRSSASLGVTLPCSFALRLWEMCLVSLVLQVGMLPLLTKYFHRVSLSGPAANVPAVLLTGLIVPLGFLSLGAALVWHPLAMALARPAGWLVGMLTTTVRWFAGWPRLSYRLPGPPQWLLLVFFGALLLLGVAAHAKRRNGSRTGESLPAPETFREHWQELALSFVLSTLCLCVATHPFAPRLDPGILEVTVLDVGQGDSIFVAFPDGRTMLMDGGGLPSFGRSRGAGYERSFDIGEQVVSPYLWERGLKRIDVVALSHAHQDHLGGLGAVLDNFSVGELWVGRDVDSAPYRALLLEARARGAALIHHHRGDSLAWGPVRGSVLWPEDSSATEKASNDDSLVIHLDFDKESFLLPGDIEHKVEGELVARGDALRADFLKIAHHGSRTSSTEAFIAAVSPEVEVISAGAGNPYGHPNADVLALLSGRGARLLRTDRDGAVMVKSDGRGMVVRRFDGDGWE
jgi:competence protein ComEC